MNTFFAASRGVHSKSFLETVDYSTLLTVVAAKPFPTGNGQEGKEKKFFNLTVGNGCLRGSGFLAPDAVVIVKGEAIWPIFPTKSGNWDRWLKTSYF